MGSGSKRLGEMENANAWWLLPLPELVDLAVLDIKFQAPSHELGVSFHIADTERAILKIYLKGLIELMVILLQDSSALCDFAICHCCNTASAQLANSHTRPLPIPSILR